MTRNVANTVMEQETSKTSAASSSSAKTAIDIRIISHNIRYATKSPFKGEELWEVRRPRLCSQLVFSSDEPSTFICLQEVLHSQLLDIHAALNESPSVSGDWAYIGVGRDDGKEAGEYNPIFYRPSVWKLDIFDTRWLSPTPDVPSKGWDAGSKRIVTVGGFSHRETGQKVVVFCTHLDNRSATARRESAKLLLFGVEAYTLLKLPALILIVGDFNSPVDDGAYQLLTSSDSTVEDVCLQIPEQERHGNEITYTSFGHVDNHPVRIDFIFARKGDKVKYRTYGVLANRFDDGVYLSDHRACIADMLLGSA